MDPHSRAPKKKTSHGNEVLLQDTTHLIQRPGYQRLVNLSTLGSIEPWIQRTLDLSTLGSIEPWIYRHGRRTSGLKQNVKSPMSGLPLAVVTNPIIEAYVYWSLSDVRRACCLRSRKIDFKAQLWTIIQASKTAPKTPWIYSCKL